jgi:uncharacterized protein (DUF885 family)
LEEAQVMLKPAILLLLSTLAIADDLDRSNSEMAAPIERFIADRATLIRTYPIEISQTRRRRLKEFLADWSARTAQMNFEAMSPDGRIDYVLFKNHLQHEIRRLDLDAKAFQEEAPLMPFVNTIIGFEESRRRMEPMDSAKTAATVNALAKQIDDARKKVESTLRSAPPKKTVANRAAVDLNNLRGTLRRWYEFYNGYDPAFTWWMAEPYKSADTALENYTKFLRERVAGVRGVMLPETGAATAGSGRGGGRGSGRGAAVPAQTPPAPAPAAPDNGEDIIGNPIGREGLMNELANEMIPYTPEELIAIANKEFAWCEDQMKRASRDLGYGDDWHKALEHVKNLYVEPGKQPDLIRDLAEEAIAFVENNDLITIPPLARETWRMEMMSPARQLVNPFFTGGEVISVSYPTSGMSEEQKLMSMRGNNIHFSRATVFHELIPGHELQGFVAARYRPCRRLFNTPFIVEGWSLYWEMLMWDLNFARSPEDRVGMLFWRMHRCARIIFSLSFHLEKMTPKESIDFLVDRVGHERDNAIGEVRRSFAGDYSPLYQAAYLLGGMQIYALHKELVGPGKMTNRAFHDAILEENSIPVEMIRADLTKQKLSADFKTSWKFGN